MAARGWLTGFYYIGISAERVGGNNQRVESCLVHRRLLGLTATRRTRKGKNLSTSPSYEHPIFDTSFEINYSPETEIP